MPAWLKWTAAALLVPVVGLLVALLRHVPSEVTTKTADGPVQPLNRPRVRLTSGYAGSDACRDCHVRNHETWHASWHRTMTQVPSADTVVPDFRDVTLTVDDRRYVLSQDDDGYWVELDDPDAAPGSAEPPRVRRQIVLMTGSHHEQDFWFETPRGRAVQRLPFVYRIAEAEWLPDTCVLLTPPNAPSGFGNWNLVCIQCHTTLGRPKVDPLTGYAATEVVEFGISCEACHGPGAAHAERYRLRDGDPDAFARLAANDEIVNPAELDHRRSVETCGQCHSVTMLSDQESRDWMTQGLGFRPGHTLADSRDVVMPDNPELADDLSRLIAQDPHFLAERFWPDGMVRVIGREANGILQSPCFQQGSMTCLSCHELHPSADDPRPLKQWADDQLRRGMETDRACLQCHESFRGEALTAHTHHPADSVGSRCYNCHMPPTTWGLLKATHSHHIDSPGLESSLVAGRPNACNLCHLDRSLAWTNNYLSDWYGAERHALTADQTAVPASVIWALSGDAGQRALLAWAMAWPPAQEASGTDWQGRILAVLLNDPYDVVRLVAGRSLKSLPGFREFDIGFPVPESQRAAQVERVLGEWERIRRAAGRSIDLDDLIHSADRPAARILDDLLRARDDRPMRLAE